MLPGKDTMNIALTAKIVFDPRSIRESQWVHDMAHRLMRTRRQALDALEAASRRVLALGAR